MTDERRLLTVFGLPGTGKSKLLHGLVREQAHVQRFLCLDHEEGWAKDGYHWQGKPPRIVDVGAGQRADEEYFNEPGVYRFPSNLWDGRAVGSLCLELPYDVVLVDDEADKAGRKEDFDNSPVRTILNEGRHIVTDDALHVVHGMFACRRPQKLHRDFDLAEEVYIFRLKGGATRRRLLDDSLIEDDDDWERIKALPNGHFYWQGRTPDGEYKSDWLVLK